MRRRRAERATEYERPAFTDLKARLAANVRGLRQQRSWTQEEAADRTRMATPLFQRVEAGATNATLITIAKLCEGFSVEAGRLFAPEPGSASPRASVKPAAGSRAARRTASPKVPKG